MSTLFTKRNTHASFIKKAHQLYPFSGGSVLHVGIVRVGLEFHFATEIEGLAL
jgi:hypothetical protein